MLTLIVVLISTGMLTLVVVLILTGMLVVGAPHVGVTCGVFDF